MTNRRLRSFAPRLHPLASALVLLVVMAASPVHAGDPAFGWFPLDAGRKVFYETERERSLQTAAGVKREFFRGQAETHVGARRGGLAPLARVESETATAMAAARPVILQRLEFYSSTAEQVLLHAQKGVGGSDEEIRYEPARVLLQAPLTKGRTWKVGELRSGEMRLDLEASVLGIEPLEVGGHSYPRTLRVAYAGGVTGRVGGAVIESGTYERMVWFATGTGLVKETVQIDLAIRDAAGASLKLSDRVVYRQAPGNAPTKPPPSLLR